MAYRKEQQPQFVAKKTCRFCEQRIEFIDYKDTKTLQRFTNSIGKIDSKKRSGNCPRHQRIIARAIKKARIMAMLPFVNR